MARRIFTPEDRALRKELRELGLSRSEIDAIAGGEPDPEFEPSLAAELPRSPEGRPVLELGAEMGHVTLIACTRGGFAIEAVDHSGALIDEPVSVTVQHHDSFDAAWGALVARRWLGLAPLRVDPAIRGLVEDRLAGCETMTAARQVEWRAALDAPEESGS